MKFRSKNRYFGAVSRLIFLMGILAEIIALPILGNATDEVKKDATSALDATAAASSLREIEARYSLAESVQMGVTKEIQSTMLKKTRTSTGMLYIQRPGKFSLNIEKPEHSRVVVDGKKIWIVEFPVDPEFDKTTRVIVSNSPEKMQAPVLMTFLMGKGSLLDHFKIVSSAERTGSLIDVVMLPKKETADVTRLTVTINTEDKTIQALALEDQLKNITKFEFSKIIFGKKLGAKTFKFKPPKDADITNL